MTKIVFFLKKAFFSLLPLFTSSTQREGFLLSIGVELQERNDPMGDGGFLVRTPA